MKIKHWQGYGCVNATKVKMTTKDNIRNLIIRVSGNHECGLVETLYEPVGDVVFIVTNKPTFVIS